MGWYEREGRVKYQQGGKSLMSMEWYKKSFLGSWGGEGDERFFRCGFADIDRLNGPHRFSKTRKCTFYNGNREGFGSIMGFNIAGARNSVVFGSVPLLA